MVDFDEFRSTAGRRRAWRGLMLGDHGLLRKLYDNTHEVTPGKLWRSYQPSPKNIKDWKARGIKTVINLRGPKPSAALFLEQEACAEHNVRLINFRVYSREAPSPEILRGARNLFNEIEYPALIHCKSGADRAGLMATLFLFLHERQPLDVALEQLSFKYGHVKHGKTGVIDAAFAEYLAYAAAHGIALNDLSAFFTWADQHYDYKRTKAKFKPTPLGTLISDILLRRE